MNPLQMFVGALLVLLQGCSSVGPVSSERIRLSGWVHSKQTSMPQRLHFKFSILGERVTGSLHPLSTQSLDVYSLPTQYSLQAHTQPLWVRYWFEFRWQQQDQWHSIKQPIKVSPLTQRNLIQFIEGEPEILWQSLD